MNSCHLDELIGTGNHRKANHNVIERSQTNMKHPHLIHLLIALAVCLASVPGKGRVWARPAEIMSEEAYTITLLPDCNSDGGQ